MHKFFLMSGAALAGIAVALGALGAHSLKASLSGDLLSIFETAVRYQFYHSTALLFAGVLMERFRGKWMRYSGYGFIGGMLLFSGSLYLIIFLKSAGTVVPTAVGILTPLGGLFFMFGWVAMLIAFGRHSNQLKSV